MSSVAELEREGREFFERNPELLRAFERAAEQIDRAGGEVSSRQLMEFVRMGRHYGTRTMHRLVDALAPVGVEGDGTHRLPNNASAYLTRHLERMGYRVKRAPSKLDAWAGR